jgi:hypothetical protein
MINGGREREREGMYIHNYICTHIKRGRNGEVLRQTELDNVGRCAHY